MFCLIILFTLFVLSITVFAKADQLVDDVDQLGHPTCMSAVCCVISFIAACVAVCLVATIIFCTLMELLIAFG